MTIQAISCGNGMSMRYQQPERLFPMYNIADLAPSDHVCGELVYVGPSTPTAYGCVGCEMLLDQCVVLLSDIFAICYDFGVRYGNPYGAR